MFTHVDDWLIDDQSKLETTVGRYPDFLCIGAQKAGSSWLHRQLLEHPQIWLPPFKEIHYFDQQKEGIAKSLRWRMSYLERQRWRVLPRRLYRNLLQRNFKSASWDLTYYFRPRTDAWYRSLFRASQNEIAGEITPDYGVVDKRIIRHIHSKMPEVKLIFLMRDPIDRAWSQAKMKLVRFRRRPISTVTVEEFLDFVSRPGVLRRSNYGRTLDNWLSVYSDEQLHTAYFEDIVDHPFDTLVRLFGFLGVDSSQSRVPASSEKKVHEGAKGRLPPQVERKLASLLIHDLRRLNDQFGGPTRAWLQRAEEALE